MNRLGKVAGCILLYLIGFDVAGVLACLFFDVASFGDSNTPVYYAVWFVLGVLCGVFSYNSAGRVATGDSHVDMGVTDPTIQDWTGRADSAESGRFVMVTTAVLLLTLSVPFYLLWWRHDMEPTGFVPDSGPLTLTFFGTVLASSIFAHKSLRPEPKKVS